MKEELIDVLDENGIKTGEVLTRKEIHQKGLWHRVVILAIVNENNEVLIQQRSATKDKHANMWDISVGGHISSGESSISTLIREVKEEIGITIQESISINDFRYLFSYRSEEIVNQNFIERQFYDFFILRSKGLKLKDITIQESEVQNVKLVTIDTIRKMIQEGIMIEKRAVYDELSKYLKK